MPTLKLNIQLSKREACPLRFLFTKADRILKRREFIALAESGRKIQNEHFIAIFSPNQLGQSRIGITVTKKVGPAVKRNRIKRLVREYFRLSRHQLAGHWDINMIAKRQDTDFSAEKSFRSLTDLVERISNYDDRQ